MTTSGEIKVEDVTKANSSDEKNNDQNFVVQPWSGREGSATTQRPAKFSRTELNKCLSQRIVLTNLAQTAKSRQLALLDFGWASYFKELDLFLEMRTEVIPIM